MGIQSTELVWGAAALAVLLPVLVAVIVGLRRGPRSMPGRAAQGLLTVVTVVVCQAVAVGAVFLYANRAFSLFDTWSDLAAQLGTQTTAPTTVVRNKAKVPGGVPISADNPHPHGQLVSLRVKPATGAFSTVTVWLPPAYFEKSQHKTRFPLLVMVGTAGMDGAKTATIFEAMTINQRLISEGMRPFIAVYMSASVHPAIDSECTNVPGTDGMDFLTSKVPQAVTRHFRVTPDHRQWFIGGYSTGGWCAAAAVFNHPEVFAAGANIAGYYHALYDRRAWSTNNALVDSTSVLAQVEQGQTRGALLLSAMSERDLQSWGNPVKDPAGRGPDGALFHQRAKDLPGMDFIILTSGGHYTGVWIPKLDQIYGWFAHLGL